MLRTNKKNKHKKIISENKLVLINSLSVQAHTNRSNSPLS